MTTIEQFLKQPNQDSDELGRVLLINIALIIIASLVSGFFTFLMRQTIINVSRYIEYDLKNEVYQHYKFFVAPLQKNRTGDLMSRISEDVGKVRMYFGPALMYSINTVALFVIVISYMSEYRSSLTLYTLLPYSIVGHNLST